MTIEEFYKEMDDEANRIADSLLSIKIFAEEKPGYRMYSLKKMLLNAQKYFEEIESQGFHGPIVIGIEQFDSSWSEDKALREIAELSVRFNKEIYLAVPSKDYSRIEDLIILMAEKEVSSWKHLKEMHKDDYVIRIVDQRRSNMFGYLKLFPTGNISLHMYRTELPEPIKTFQLDTTLLEEAKSFAKDRVNNQFDILQDIYAIDDRCFSDCFRMECGFAWLGKETIPYSTSEYFKEKSEYSVINKIMSLPQLKEFTDVSHSCT